MERWTRLWGFVLGVALVTSWAGAARAEMYEMTILPPQPHVGDTIRVLAKGAFSASCWRDTSQTCAIVAGDSLKFTVDVDYCEGHMGCGCLTVMIYYDRTCTFGPLPAGSYAVVFTERHIWYDPEPTVTTVLPFTVTDATPVREGSWGRVKVLYR